MSVSLRRATELDIDAIQLFGSKLLNYERENFDPSLDAGWAFTDAAKEKYLAAIREKYVIIAEEDGAPVGYLIGSIIAPKAGDARGIKQANLQNIYTNEERRGIGIGKMMLDNFRSYCRSEGVDRLNVSVLADNKVAVGFYEENGLRPRSINLFQNL